MRRPPLNGSKLRDNLKFAISKDHLEEAVVLLRLREELTGLTVTQLARFLRKKLYPKASKREIYKKVHRILDKLEEKEFVKTKTIGNYRFAKITLEGLRFLAETLPEWSKQAEVDLNNRLGCTKHLITNYRASREWFEIAIRLLTKPVERFEPIDKELLVLNFTTWLENISDKVLVFMDPETRVVVTKPYRTRFNSPEYIKLLLAKYDEAWKIASENYDVGVFLTVTLPPIFPLKIEQYLLSYILHRLRNWLKRRYGFTPPSIVGNEPQESLNFHKHIVFFGISRIMDKRELTLWLDDKVIRFLENMGHHIQKTVNNRLKPEEVKVFNKLGKKLLKRYLRYKKKHKGYQGPVNWITKVYKDENGKWVFENLPPDLQGNKKDGTF
ncbi:hypothetical protein Arcpr_1857 (plasmid) [Archaeoglobus profundus DSM 5631]|uniref:Uncharacterized protein n=1 Tax=Archaeoglobus profundus (strain DSM 5631 / JCM 9629 / NBRC 100127 / Av18) TaxID=572546 RepID=D2RIC7_ARCPA|nr:hypothetical protein Arcpr_1857 [Archaeoglobus profundus DSM 5631]